MRCHFLLAFCLGLSLLLWQDEFASLAISKIETTRWGFHLKIKSDFSLEAICPTVERSPFALFLKSAKLHTRLKKFPFLYASSLKSRRGDELLNTYFIRPLAAFFVGLAFPLPVLPIHIVLLGTAFGLAAALAVAIGNLVWGGILLFIKNILDAVDGQLARARHQEDRRGRFLDSISDFAVNFLVFLALGFFLFHRTGKASYFGWAALAFLSLSLRVSYFVYYFVSFLHSEKKLGLNRTLEEITEADRQGDPVALLLQKIYIFLYNWQDRLVHKIDISCTGPAASLPPEKREHFYRLWVTHPRALRLSSFLGLGTELSFVILALILKIPAFYLVFNLLGLNGFALFCIFYRRRLAQQLVQKLL